ncbi:hypothetical protein P175DRAFT_0486389 [Aspergillus ochraceoroseus IBT 24754]|uniref:Mmc1 C-terminal domain-containing protein n=1 Tax=Aspergillus ochraceoroseus IBT 24754 TaxID=1392256 RepID=A0A2T5LNA6_9EURO|nr:uncharacterized protein P175DRAFT_0486389 [Aspergillus ochraceoroseus IBT 24754]PTU17757.1 hypothetical protein P175DRAFT_0486389 [Aspergillus ochraceoroseus IBT 24754]
MPPRLRGSLAKSLPHTGDAKNLFYCPSCAVRQRSSSSSSSSSSLPTRRVSSRTQPHLQSSRSRRLFSTASPVPHTARHVPPRLRTLYESLARIQDVATEQVNLSRLQLALRGLESEEPLIRVAVLGLNDVAAARKLVRLLLADPLKGREDWEDVIDVKGGMEGLELDMDMDLERGLLIRYGQVSESIPNNLLPTISVPSSILEKGNLEILVTSLGAGADISGAQLTADTFLVPTVTIQTSHSGRHNMVRYPVHRSIVCASGVDGLLAYSGLIARSDLKKEADSVYAAVEMAVSRPQANNDRIAFVDTRKADEALAKFRESVQNATLYERGWNSSGVQPVVEWLSSLRAKEGSLDVSLRSLITSLIDTAEQGVAFEEARKAQELEAASVSEAARESMDRSVSTWAERAHTELRSALEEGFASKSWSGLAWWKLFWRVDDVGMITSEILEKKYLCRAEKEVIWTAGQLEQAGLQKQQTTPKEEEAQWPTQITKSRARLLETTVPSLQALAQRLVLFSLSTTTLTSALSALTYVSVPTASVYEACTITAVGLIYSLRRQQRKWEAARGFWEEEVLEDGRRSLLETEDQLRIAVREGGRPEVAVSQSDARMAITAAREALEDVH